MKLSSTYSFLSTVTHQAEQVSHVVNITDPPLENVTKTLVAQSHHISNYHIVSEQLGSFQHPGSLSPSL